MINLTTACQIASIEHTVVITFSSKEVIELTPKQYSELTNRIIQELCLNCPNK
jgi:hypothetical protein